ncbi:hypothetical protein DSO57_1037952 [Entomophthora muscae]|uniref:Uncharacterized protein n=1 Tax=Entomophthora muscae TaxID=34485 RepID=A0ACC2TWQ5_9FUNG|nr:hypothetical protein DSO57_1037952 [Entomophthora muscae]
MIYYKAVGLLDADEQNLAKNDLMAGFVDYFKDHWTGKFIEKQYGPGKNRIGWNYVDYVLAEGIKTTSALEGWHNCFAKSARVSKPSSGKLSVVLKNSKDRADRILRPLKMVPLPLQEKPAWTGEGHNVQSGKYGLKEGWDAGIPEEGLECHELWVGIIADISYNKSFAYLIVVTETSVFVAGDGKSINKTEIYGISACPS